MEVTTAPTTLATDRLELRADPAMASATRVRFAIHAGAERIGWIALTIELHMAWLHFEIAEAHRGKGYAREAVTTLSRVAFAHHNAADVRIRCNAKEGGAAVAQACGFISGKLTASTPVWVLTPALLAAHDSEDLDARWCA